MNTLALVSINTKDETVTFTYDTDAGGPFRASMPLADFRTLYVSTAGNLTACFTAALALRKDAESSFASAQGRLDEVNAVYVGKLAEVAKLDAEIAAKTAKLADAGEVAVAVAEKA